MTRRAEIHLASKSNYGGRALCWGVEWLRIDLFDLFRQKQNSVLGTKFKSASVKLFNIYGSDSMQNLKTIRQFLRNKIAAAIFVTNADFCVFL